MNELAGSIPRSWLAVGGLPSGLQVLYLSGNMLTGQVPQDWSFPKSLQVVTLYDNQLTGRRAKCAWIAL